MKVDISDRPQRKVSHATWRPYAAAIVVSTLLSSGMIYLYSTGWGVTVNLQKLKEAFVVNGQDEPQKSWSAELPSDQPTINPKPLSSIPEITSVQPRYEEASAYYLPPEGMRPIGWDVHMKTFNRVFVQHPACNPHDMKWTQMECSNFRARAMKRFGVEWSNGAYWDGKNFVENKDATDRVNSELTW